MWREVAEGPHQPVPSPPLGSARPHSHRRGWWGLGRYHVERPAALPDAVCIEHMEDAAEDPRVCKEEGRRWKAWAPVLPGPLDWQLGGPRAFRGHS